MFVKVLMVCYGFNGLLKVEFIRLQGEALVNY